MLTRTYLDQFGPGTRAVARDRASQDELVHPSLAERARVVPLLQLFRNNLTALSQLYNVSVVKVVRWAPSECLSVCLSVCLPACTNTSGSCTLQCMVPWFTFIVRSVTYNGSHPNPTGKSTCPDVSFLARTIGDTFTPHAPDM
jgi:hypothetical protein